MITNFKPDICLSLGENCLSAGILKSLNLKNESYLFDWAACEKFDILLDILNNDLGHHIYNNINNNNVVNTMHNFQLGEGDRSKIIYLHHPEDKEYQIKVAQRFFDTINNDSLKILFIYSYGMASLNISDDEFDNLIKIMINKYPNLNFKILILHYAGEYFGEDNYQFNLVRNTDIIYKYDFYTKTRPPWPMDQLHEYEIFKFLFF
uniref:Papain-like cysteine peptidase n=1 Tax=viral metagenome TaxID=1070528 RepID=A0A6C0ER66_9ZZZZ